MSEAGKQGVLLVSLGTIAELSKLLKGPLTIARMSRAAYP